MGRRGAVLIVTPAKAGIDGAGQQLARSFLTCEIQPRCWEIISSRLRNYGIVEHGRHNIAQLKRGYGSKALWTGTWSLRLGNQ